MSTLRVSAIKLRDNAAWRLAVMCSLLSLSVAVAFGQPGGNVSLSNGYPGLSGTASQWSRQACAAAARAFGLRPGDRFVKGLLSVRSMSATNASSPNGRPP